MIIYSPNAWPLTDLWGMGLLGLSLVAFAIVIVMGARHLRGR